MSDAAPTTENRTLRRLPNAAYRQREYLTETEVERLIDAPRKRPCPVHPHILRHSTGCKLANNGHDTRSLAHYLGHRNLQSTARYTAWPKVGSRSSGKTYHRQSWLSSICPPLDTFEA